MDNYPPGAKDDKSAPYNKPTYIDCPECEGVGHFLLSDCCGAEIVEDMDICTQCRDHCGVSECDECNGTGLKED